MPAATAIMIGNFDGVHLGHVELVHAARSAVGDDGRVIALSFEPHPITVLRGEAPGRLTSIAERTRLLDAAGADEVVVLEATRELLLQPPEAFIEAIVAPYRAGVIVEGPDFHFGRNRAGNVETLRELQARFGYHTIVIDPVEVALIDGTIVRVSSTMIRWLLEQGRVPDAARLLGRPFELVGPVVCGDRRGRSLGVPTANLDHRDLMLPGDGIYAGVARREEADHGLEWRPAAISIGTKPTFGDLPRVCEAHIIGHDGQIDEYDWTLRIRFTHWLRDQIRYPDADALTAQLGRDIARTEELCRQGAASHG
jgi:riboflavin kinase/FMN adenylyltransferase